jgi:hypothetical protein
MNETTTRRCPFAAPITTGRAACSHAVEVVRRGGCEYDCDDADAHRRCGAVFNGLKHVGLAALGVADDLTQMPHSALVKVQTGGLAGLRRLLALEGGADAPIADVSLLTAQAAQTHGGVARIPFAEVAGDIADCRLDRRSRRRGR